MSTSHTNVKIICSYHNFEKTPHDLPEILARMQKPFFYGYKFSCLANSSLEGMRMLLFVRKCTSEGKRVSGMCMGEKGQFTRVLGKICGSFMTYASMDATSSLAPGQLSAHEMLEVYQYKNIDASACIYGIIGGSTAASLSHFIHNRVMKAFNLHSIYVKIDLVPEELGEFFSLAKDLGVRGLSVTMPLKESVISFLDEIDMEAKKIGAVNTISFQNGKSKGFNTDGKGALDAIEERGSIQGKRVVILGAGGAAKATSYVALQRGASVTILNRSVDKALTLASQFGLRGGGLEQMEEEYKLRYDVLVNCTPNPLPISPEYILSSAVIMETKNVPKETELLIDAKKKGAKIVYGYEMLCRQAVLQEEIWFQEKVGKQEVSELIFSEVLSHL
jgi:3-dehydroquinate dehydratase/shikimate dehydrogenase